MSPFVATECVSDSPLFLLCCVEVRRAAAMVLTMTLQLLSDSPLFLLCSVEVRRAAAMVLTMTLQLLSDSPLFLLCSVEVRRAAAMVLTMTLQGLGRDAVRSGFFHKLLSLEEFIKTMFQIKINVQFLFDYVYYKFRPGKQCCGSGMIYSGSGSSFEFSEFRIRIQAKVQDPCGSRSNLY